MSKFVFRKMKLVYLKHNFPVVAMLKDGEYNILSSKSCKEGDTVWVLEGEDLVKTKIF